MAWFQDLAGKAETMLNKLDQNAAVVLHSKDEAPKEELKKPLLPTTSQLPPPGAAKLQITPRKAMKLTPPLAPSVPATDDFDRRSSSSRRSSTTQEGSVIEKVNEQPPAPALRPVSSLSNLANSGGGGVADKELAAMRISVGQLKEERDSLARELDLVQSSNNNVRLAELEEICNNLVAEKEYLTQQNAENIKNVSDLEATVARHLKNENELRQKLEWARNETNQAFVELQQYRARAQSTLQMKEKQIEELKAGLLGVDPRGGDVGAETRATTMILTQEVEALRAERAALAEELQTVRENYEQSRQFARTHREDNADWERRVAELQDALRFETEKKRLLEAENQKMAAARDEAARQTTATTLQLSDRDAEIQKLRARLAQRLQSPAGDHEARIQSLTQSLVKKQQTLEAVTAERNALRLQMEKMDSFHRAELTEVRNQRPVRLDVNETDDVKARVPNFLQETPFDTRLSRRVKRAYSNLDAAGVRLGVFLRRYPLIRICVIVYIVFLHLWVMLVLFSSTPN